jgi:hypothetical protein
MAMSEKQWTEMQRWIRSMAGGHEIVIYQDGSAGPAAIDQYGKPMKGVVRNIQSESGSGTTYNVTLHNTQKGFVRF